MNYDKIKTDCHFLSAECNNLYNAANTEAPKWKMLDEIERAQAYVDRLRNLIAKEA